MGKLKVKVLKGLKMMLKALSLFNENGAPVCGIEIPKAVIILCISATLILHFSLTIWFCIEFEFDLKIISGAVSIASGSLQVQLIYICLACHGRLVPSSINELQTLVQQSE